VEKRQRSQAEKRQTKCPIYFSPLPKGVNQRFPMEEMRQKAHFGARKILRKHTDMKTAFAIMRQSGK
jgi:hypothetical protein